MLVLSVLLIMALTAGALTALTWYVVSRRMHAAPVTHGTARVVAAELRRHRRAAEVLRRRTSPRELTGLALTLAVMALVVVAFLLFQVRTDSTVVELDRDVSQWAAANATKGSSDVLDVLTDAGGTPFVIATAVVVGIVEAVRTTSTRVLVFLFVVVAGQFALNNLLKVVVERDRPDVEPLVGASGYSFPSGHSSGAVACFAACALCLGRGRSPRVHLVLAAVTAMLAVMVATSRVLLGVHWLSDVVAGLCFGAAWFTLCAVAFGGRLLRFGAPVEAAERVTGFRSAGAEDGALR